VDSYFLYLNAFVSVVYTFWFWLYFEQQLNEKLSYEKYYL